MATSKRTTSKRTSQPIADMFRATGAELRAASEAGNEAATAEIARRKANKAAPSA